MRLDTSGNLGIGTSSPTGKLSVSLASATGTGGRGSFSAWDSTYAVFGNTAATSAAVGIGFNTTNGGVLTSIAPNTAWQNMNYLALSHQFYISGAEKMRLDSSGNLGIGTSSPTAGFRLDVQATTARQRIESTTGTNEVQQRLINSGGTFFLSLDNSTGTGFGAAYSAVLWHSGNYPMLFATNNTERARITSGGVFCVNSTSNIGAEVTLFKQTSGVSSPATRFWNDATTGDNEFVEFATETSYTARGSITYNRSGGLVAYNVTSDYRAKDILGPVQDSGATIDALKVYDGQMKGATQSRPMLVAHEAQEHAPYAVTGEKDAVNEDGTPNYQQMDVSALVPLLLAEIQSLRARVAQLESK